MTNKRFSEEQVAELKEIAALPTYSKEKTESISKFAKKHKCDRKKVLNWMYNHREEKVEPMVNQATLKRTEFIIPVNNYELRSENGKLNLVIKF